MQYYRKSTFDNNKEDIKLLNNHINTKYNKLNNYHIKFDEINDMIDIIISDGYTKVYRAYYPMKNYDLSQDQFLIYNAVIDTLLKRNTCIIFEYSFNSEYIDIPLIVNFKIDDILEKNFNINF